MGGFFGGNMNMGGRGGRGGGGGWSARNESWRGPWAPPVSDERWRPPQYQEPQGSGDYQFGPDRAPTNIDEAFLRRCGAKRLNSGHLVDRNGFTLQSELYDESQRNLDNISQDDLDKKVQQQIEMMRKMEDEEKKKKEKKKEAKKLEESEGEDEYEEVPPEPEHKKPEIANATATAPEPGPSNFAQKYKKKTWFNAYQESVQELKRQVYGRSLLPNPAPVSSGYFFQSPPPSNLAPAPVPVPVHVPIHTPSSSRPPPKKVPRVELPPPGIVNMGPSTSSRQYGNVDAFGAPIRTRDGSASSESDEDEAIVKLKEIIRNYGQ
uniref:Uncharacterized protein n=1 Tax=Caenorhabditis japonica TaxID=281687 RepID=A0A8R1DFS3_CAEJA